MQLLPCIIVMVRVWLALAQFYLYVGHMLVCLLHKTLVYCLHSVERSILKGDCLHCVETVGMPKKSMERSVKQSPLLKVDKTMLCV